MYSLDEYYRDLEAVGRSGAHVEVIGHSTLGRAIHLITKGEDTSHPILVQAGMHAREYITTPLVMHLMREYSGSGYIALIPSVNIDGMLLVLEGIDSIEDSNRRDILIEANRGSYDFSLWKANANAVDLNVNFNANWSRGEQNIDYRANANYVGKYPMSEVENQILAGITLKLQPKITLSYHTKGNLVYTGYEDNIAHIDIANKIAKFINYPLYESRGSYGGYKDWFMATTPYLGLTIECGDDSLNHPIGLEALGEMEIRHSGLFSYVSRLARDID